MTLCPNCGSENAEGARFCSTCGHSLMTRVAVEERRHVTALFADLVASTSLSDRLDPEVVRGVVSRYFEQAEAEIRGFGGSVEKFSGDAVMAVFGLQQAHEDDPERAVRAAFAVRDALAELAPEAATRHGIELQVRIGIEAGEVVVGDPFGGATMATGDPLNVAARLEQHAQPGEIVVGPAVHAVTGRAIAYEPAGAWEVHGKSEAVEAWRATGVLSAPGEGRGIEGHEAPLTGRDEELTILRDAARRARSDNKAILFTVLGLPGVGKSRLTRELSSELRTDGWQILRGRCLPYGEGITYWPIAEIVRGLAGIGPEMDHDEAVARLAAASPDAGTADVLAFAIGLSTESPVSGEAMDREIAFAFRRLLEEATVTAPVALVVEDIHWAETPLLDLLEYVATWARDRPLLIVCLARPDLLDIRPAWGSGRMEASRLQLEPLTREETATLVRSLLEVEGLPETLREQVLDRAEGNPLFVEETIRMLLERGAVVEREGRWVASESIGQIEVPDSIEALIRARLDALPREERSVLQGASVIGRVFQRSAVATLVDEPVERHLEQAVLRDIVTEEPAADPSYRFKHIAIRDVAYATLPKARRALLHQRVVEWLVGWAGDRRAEFVEIEAYHLEQAARLTRELEGAVDPRLLQNAVRALKQSAEKAQSWGDGRGVIGFAERAMALEPPEDEDLLEIQTMLVEALTDRGDTGRAAEIGGPVAEAAAAAGRRDLQGRVLLRVAQHVWVGGSGEHDKTKGIALMREARDVLQQAGDKPHEADALFWLGFDGWWDGDLDRAAEVWREQVAVAREAGDVSREVSGLIRLAHTATALGNREEYRSVLARIKELAPSTSRLTQSQVMRLEGAGLMVSGDDIRGAERLLLESLRIGEEADNFMIRFQASMGLGDLALLEEDYATALVRFEAVVELVDAAQHAGWQSEARVSLSYALLALDDLAGAEETAEQAVDMVAADDVYTMASSRRALGMVRERQNRIAEARPLFEASMEIARGLGFRTERAEFTAAMGEFLLAAGETDEGDALIASAKAEMVACFGPRSPLLSWVERRAEAARARARAREATA